jgi:hypothetical protein
MFVVKTQEHATGWVSFDVFQVGRLAWRSYRNTKWWRPGCAARNAGTGEFLTALRRDATRVLIGCAEHAHQLLCCSATTALSPLLFCTYAPTRVRKPIASENSIVHRQSATAKLHERMRFVNIRERRLAEICGLTRLDDGGR